MKRIKTHRRQIYVFQIDIKCFRLSIVNQSDDFQLVLMHFLGIHLYLLELLLSLMIDPREFVTAPAVVNTVVVLGGGAVVCGVAKVVVFISSTTDEDAVTDDEVAASDEDSKDGHAKTTPSDPDDHPKSATEHVDELIVGEEPKINTNPSPSTDGLEELDDEKELDDE